MPQAVSTLRQVFVSLCLVMLPSVAGAQVVFTWAENGSGVTMTASGSIDTAQLTAITGGCDTWGGWGHESGSGTARADIIGDTEAGSPDTCFKFSTGTDFSPWQTDNPFSGMLFGVDGGYDSTSVTTPFHTYHDDENNAQRPGLAVMASDLSGTVWTPSGGWVKAGGTFASMKLNVGIYTVTDANTGASITFAIGKTVASAAAEPATPVPTLPLYSLFALGGLLGFFGLRKLKK